MAELRPRRSNPRFMSLFLLLAAACGDDVPALELTTSTLANVRLGSAVDAKLEARGGTPPYKFALASGSLPDGVILKADTGQLSGIAGSPGEHAFSIRVTDQDEASASKALTLYVVPNALEVVTTALPPGREQSAFTA